MRKQVGKSENIIVKKSESAPARPKGSNPRPVTITKILIADDHSVTRRGLRALLETKPQWKVCGEAANGLDAVFKAKRLKPDVVVMDISMPEVNGLEATRRMRKEMPELPVVILTMHDSEELIQELVNAGARGYILKSDLDVNLFTGVKAVLDGKTFFSAKVSEIVLEGYVKTARSGLEAAKQQAAELSPRQRQIVRYLAEGKLNKEVAAELGISTKTVEAHRSNIMARLKLRSFSDLVRYAVRQGIVEP